MGHLQVRSAFIERALADEVLRHQLLVALLVGQRNRQFRQALLNLGQGQLVIKLHQHLPFAHALTVGEIELGDAPTHLRAQHHAPARTQTAYRLGVVRELHNFHFGDLYRRWLCACGGTGAALCWRSSRGRARGRIVAGLGFLVPPRRTGSSGNTDHCDHHVNCF